MEFWQKIQRVPRGLAEVLGLAGGHTPQSLLGDVRPTLEQLQLYGLSQLQVLTAVDGALAEGGVVTITLDRWSVLFGAQFNVTKTATITALTGNVILFRAFTLASMVLESRELGPFGAAETGVVTVPWRSPYPLVCAPGTLVQGQMPILAGDATAQVNIRCEVGVLG